MTILVNSLMWLLSLIPPFAAEKLAHPLAGLLWRLNARRRTNTLINLSLCYPSLEEAKRESLGRESMVHYIRNILEAGLVWHWPEQRLLDLFDEPSGHHHLDQARALGKGVILAAPHFGSWELCNLFLKNEWDGAVLYKPSRSEAFDQALRDSRSRTGIEMVPANQAGLKSIYKHLRGGRTVGILPDQEPSFGDGEFAPFMGVATMTSVLIPRLVARTGAAVVFIGCERLQGGRFKVHFLPSRPEISSADMIGSLTALNRGVEDCISLAPAQYLWAYKRFRNRPPGEAPVY